MKRKMLYPDFRNAKGTIQFDEFPRWNYSHWTLILSSARIDVLVFIYFQIRFIFSLASFRVELVVFFFVRVSPDFLFLVALSFV